MPPAYEFDDLAEPPDPQQLERTASYQRNALNQYERAQQTSGPAPFSTEFEHDADGNLVRVASYGDANCDDALNHSDTDGFVAAIIYGTGVPPYPTPDPAPSSYLATGATQSCWEERGSWGDVNGDGLFNGFDIDPYVNVLIGGASSPSYKTYVWDAENRLIEVRTTTPTATSHRKFVYVYDYMGRRVRKTEYAWVLASGGTAAHWNTTPATDVKFVYDGWNLIAELDALNLTSGDPTMLRKYTWGLDLSGLNGNPTVGGLHGAGGIGGLLACHDVSTSTAKTHAYCYDGNGNVGQLAEITIPSGSYSSTPTVAAKYEYDPYGNSVAKSGAFVDVNPFRFSTKLYDTETGLYYYGYRYYDALRGRWMSRDPVEELGNLNLYGFDHNNGVDVIDPLGGCDGKSKCTTCCCVDKLDLTGSYVNLPRAGANGDIEWVFNVQTTLRYVASNKQGNCTIEWWEWSNYPLSWKAGNNRETWADGAADPNGWKSPVFNEIRNHADDQAARCPGYSTDYNLVDKPHTPTGGFNREYDKKQTLYIAIKVSNAPGCPCGGGATAKTLLIPVIVDSERPPKAGDKLTPVTSFPSPPGKPPGW